MEKTVIVCDICESVTELTGSRLWPSEEGGSMDLHVTHKSGFGQDVNFSKMEFCSSECVLVWLQQIYDNIKRVARGEEK